MEKDIQNIINIMISKSIEEEVENIYNKINEINLKLNRITSKFDYLIELLNEVGQGEDDEDEGGNY